MTWTQSSDMHSGGGAKEQWENIYIECGEDTAQVVFYNRFGHSADRVSCTGCGADYSVMEYETLREATAYERGCDYDRGSGGYIERWNGQRWTPYQTVADYSMSRECLIITSAEIPTEQMLGEVPVQGYVWRD